MFATSAPHAAHQRLSVNNHMRDSLVHTLEDVARGVAAGMERSGIQKLQTIMTEAKEKVRSP